MKQVQPGEAVCASLYALVGAPMFWLGVPDRAEAAEDTEIPSVVIIGKRASLASAQEIKRSEIGIVDAVVAEDIQKLPDLSVSEALQRVTGVQIARDRGDGGAVAIRGLSQTETTLNGREVFTAGSGRTLDFADIPAEMIASIRVHKTSTAQLIEGGVGGLIDLRTRRPFDFQTSQFVASGRWIHGDLVDRAKPQVSTLASRRWTLDGGGEFGALLSLSHQARAWREDQKSDGNPILRTDLIPGTTVTAPNGTTETTSVGERSRSAGTLVLQWRLSERLELYAEGSAARFKTRQDSHQINVQASPTFVPGSPTLFAGTTDLKSITWTDAPVSVLSFARDTVDKTQQAALGGSWRDGALTLKADLSRTRSANTLFFSGPFMASTAASFSQDLSHTVPSTSVAGTDLLDPANLRYTGVAYRSRRFEGGLKAARLDGEYRPTAGFIDKISAGWRFADRDADNAAGTVFGDAAVTGLTAADRPQSVMPNPYTSFLPGTGARSIGRYLVGDLGMARDAQALRDAFGIVAPMPTTANPLSLWRIAERSHAAYLMASFHALGGALDGNAGLRLLRTRRSVAGWQSEPATGAVLPIALDNSDHDLLPSLNLRHALSEKLYLRASASKTLTHPNFDQLSPSLTLLRNSINPTLNQGSAGNPALRPLRATNLDLALEAYLDPASSLYLTGFVKRVDGFLTTLSAPEVHDGVTYQVSRPQNSDKARIQGLEFGYQQFFTGLPGWLGGVGLQGNYTYVDSETPSRALGRDIPLQNLSRHSANLIALYERGPISARVAYNWRSSFLSSVASFVGVGALPVYTRGYGWLDASASLRIGERLVLSVEGSNLLRTLRRSYYGVGTRPESHWLNDRQISVAASIRF
ncbi:MAG TPA: TonB-dependent receptor [Ideonella sp.]|nr:TonB-dependent receptor [Ideonella sp.]